MFILIFLLIIQQPARLYTFEICNHFEAINCEQKNPDNNKCHVAVSNSTEICESVDYTRGEKLTLNIGDVSIYLNSNPLLAKLLFGFNPSVNWKRALIKISDYNNPTLCQALTFTRNEFLTNNLDYACLLNKNIDPKEDFLIEVYFETDSIFTNKKILFNLPNALGSRNVYMLSPKHIFSYIDFTNPGKIILKIQPLDQQYNVTHYKIEVFRENKDKHTLLDVRLIYAKNIETLLSFEYFTYSEEGSYYFAISEISQRCHEDMCYKTLTPKVNITRKIRPLVIGIVGASTLIPIFLIIFYFWNWRSYKQKGLFTSDPIQKVLVLFKPSFEKHNEVVTALVNSIETLSDPPVLVDCMNLTKVKEKNAEKFCSDNLILATHIVYVNPPLTDDESSGLDYMTFNFLKEETKKVTTNRKLIVVRFPYSKIDSPSILSKASHYELVKDFEDFIKKFSELQPQRDYFKTNIYVELAKKIEVARIEGDHLKIVPEIVVTEEVEDANEVDGLIGC